MQSQNVKRIALFAHYDADAIIDEYVLCYLRGLREVCDRIIFVSDVALSKDELQKLDGVSECVHAAHHGEYDFGSWKRGFAAIEAELPEYQELVLANDSCYGPVFSFADTFAGMAQRDCDFWGTTASGGLPGSEHVAHVNSYFMVFRQPVLESGLLNSFFPGVSIREHKDDVIQAYEIGLSQTLIQSGFKLGSLTGIAKEYCGLSAAFVNDQLFRDECPLIKVWVFRQTDGVPVASIDRLLLKLNQYYPSISILRHCDRTCSQEAMFRWFFRLKNARYKSSWGLFKFRSKYTRNERWWFCYAKLLFIPVFVFGIPVFLFPFSNARKLVVLESKLRR